MSRKSVCVVSDLYVNCLAFHSRRQALLAGTVSGALRLYSCVGWESEPDISWSNGTAHTKSVRKVGFSPGGESIVSVSADKRISLLDVEGSSVKWCGKGHKDAVSAFCFVDEHVIASGDDEGEIRIWDTRVPKSTCRSRASEFLDPIAGLLPGKNGKELLAISADQLGCFDLKNGKVSLQGMSDNVEDELQCFSFVKSAKKVVCGTNTGHLCFFSYGHWGDLNDRVDVHSNSIDSLVAYDDDTVLTGGDDGKIHVISIHPNEVRGTLDAGTSSSNTDCLCLSSDRSLLAFVADFDNIVIASTDHVSSLLEGTTEENTFFGDL